MIEHRKGGFPHSFLCIGLYISQKSIGNSWEEFPPS